MMGQLANFGSSRSSLHVDFTFGLAGPAVAARRRSRSAALSVMPKRSPRQSSQSLEASACQSRPNAAEAAAKT